MPNSEFPHVAEEGGVRMPGGAGAVMQDRARHRVLYLMHVDWGWIKQRPHFIAEGLAAAGHHVCIAYVATVRRGRMTPNSAAISRYPIPLFPRWGTRMASMYNRTVGLSIATLLAATYRPTVTWITFPSLIEVVPTRLAGHVVYDAMDRAMEFYSDTALRRRVLVQESEVVRRASLVVASSNTISDTITARHAMARPPVVVHNAFDGDRDWRVAKVPSTQFRATYIGTVSWWFDFDVILRALNAYSALDVHIYGPADRSIPHHPRLRYHGVVAHDQLHTVAAVTDCFILPFVVNDLIRGVDPVKLYEYIAMGRPVVSVDYPELQHFGPHIHRYQSANDFVMRIGELMRHPLAAMACEPFLARNTWRTRWEVIDGLLRRWPVSDSRRRVVRGVSHLRDGR